jgi:ABC-type glycerol-3-phosphate transport system substrate-binding protein
MKRNLALALFLILILSLAACGGGSLALIGRWSLEPGQPTSGNIEEMELLTDKTGIVDGVGINWKAENGRFYVTHSLGVFAWGYKISGGTLTLTNDSGENLTYKRKINTDKSGAGKPETEELLGLANQEAIPAESGNITVWSFTDEVEGLINNYYRRDNPNLKLTYVYTPTDQFESSVDPVLSAGIGVPDVFALEAAFVRKYVEGGQLLDLTDIYERNKSKLLAYPVEVGTYNGRVYAMSWQACPGAMFYRRSIARKYFGTDDPAVVQTYFTDLNKFMETAELLKQQSNGACVVVSSRGDLYNVFLGARSSPWVVNGRLVIDPAMEWYMEMSKIIHENRYDARVGQWSGGWFEGMRDELIRTNGRPYEVFSYFLPTWGLHYVLKTNTTRYNGSSTAGDWAMIQGPAPYRWGGTWLAAWKGTKNPVTSKQLIEYIATNDSFLERYALDSGDMVGNLTVVNRIKDNFTEPFLGGQNHYAAFAEMALGINGRLVQGTDQSIEGLFSEQVTAYVNGEKTKEQALADFRTQAQRYLGLN